MHRNKAKLTLAYQPLAHLAWFQDFRRSQFLICFPKQEIETWQETYYLQVYIY